MALKDCCPLIFLLFLFFKFVCDRDSAFEMEPEDIARVGQRNQSRKRSALAHVNKGIQNLLEARRKQDRLV